LYHSFRKDAWDQRGILIAQPVILYVDEKIVPTRESVHAAESRWDLGLKPEVLLKCVNIYARQTHRFRVKIMEVSVSVLRERWYRRMAGF
jgi:hypothetical protein